MAPCPECGYEFESLDHDQILRALTSLARELAKLLGSQDTGLVRAHPVPASWSVLEYGCHVRDVLRFQRDRVMLAQVEDRPRFTSMRRDERAIEEGYNHQEPRAVAGQIAGAAGDLVAALGALGQAGWLRTGWYPWPTRGCAASRGSASGPRTNSRTTCSTAGGC